MQRTIVWIVVSVALAASGCAPQKKDDDLEGERIAFDRSVMDLSTAPPAPAAPAGTYVSNPAFAPSPAGGPMVKFAPVDAAPAPYAPSPYTASSYSRPAYAPSPYGTAPYSHAVTPDLAPMSQPVTNAAPAPASAVAPLPGAGGSEYKVQQGDTLFRIARMHYGNGNHWQRITMANPGLRPETLKAGTTIIVP